MREGRLIGIDYGLKRVGLAVCDAFQMVATPHKVLNVKSPEDAVRQVALEIREQEAVGCVAGLPLNMDGSRGPAAEGVEKFATALRETAGVDVVLQDERMTTMAAERVLLEADASRARRKQVIDKMSAQIILQAYLDTVTIPCVTE